MSAQISHQSSTIALVKRHITVEIHIETESPSNLFSAVWKLNMSDQVKEAAAALKVTVEAEQAQARKAAEEEKERVKQVEQR